MIGTRFRLLTSVATIFLILASCSKKGKNEREQNIFDVLAPGYNVMSFLAEIEKKDMPEVSDSLETKFENIGFQAEENLPLIIGNNTLSRPEGTFMWSNPKNGVSVFLQEFNSKKDANSHWQEFRHHIGRYTGTNMGIGGTFYLKMEPELPTSLNATFLADNKIFQLRKPLTFVAIEASELNKSQQKEVVDANQGLLEALEVLVDIFVLDKDKVYRPFNGKPLSEKERMFGFINFWTEVKYNFAFFDQTPNLDWQQVLLDYLPKVINANSNLAYYEVLQEICALLNDGHTNIYLPRELQMKIGAPAVKITAKDGAFFVTNTDKRLGETMPLGSELIGVNGIRIQEYIEEHIRPYISSST